MKGMDIIFIIGIIICCGLLYFIAGYAKKVLSNKWRLCYGVPFFAGLLYIGYNQFEICMLSVYVGACILLIGFVKESEKLRKQLCVIGILCAVLAFPICVCSSKYRVVNYLADFEKGYATMKQYYILGDYKEIDWDALYKQYQPQFQAVTKSQDAVDNYCLWQEFCQEFHDGHVYFESSTKNIEEEGKEKLVGQDYGMSVVRQSDGTYVAVNVEAGSVAQQAGIQNGTIICKWNGEDPAAVQDALTYSMSGFAVEENERFYNALLVAGQGQQEVTVTFINEAGTQQSVTLSADGSYYKRLMETIEILDRKVDADNLGWKEINETTACLNIDFMMYDSHSYEESYDSGAYRKMTNAVRQHILELKEQGIQNLILDLRNNQGGSTHFDMAVAELLAPLGSHTYAYESVWDSERKDYVRDEKTGKPVKGKGFTYEGEGLFADGQILILTNGMCVSAGDHLVAMLSSFDNVTVMGFTPSYNSGQAISGISLESGSLCFSSCPVLTEAGDFFVDTDASREAKVAFDVQVPFDEEAVHGLFDEGQDVVLNQAIEWITEKTKE